MTDLAELAILEFSSTRDIYSLGFEILVDHVLPLYRVTHLLADWVILTQFRLRIASKLDRIDFNMT